VGCWFNRIKCIFDGTAVGKVSNTNGGLAYLGGAYLGCKNNLIKKVDSFIVINGRYNRKYGLSQQINVSDP
jgi:hypothetical protein